METVKITWGRICVLEYGQPLRGYENHTGPTPVYSGAGIIGQHDVPLVPRDGVIVGRKGTLNIHYSPSPFFVIDTAFYLVPTKPIYPLWAYYELQTQKIDRLNSGSTMPSLRREDFYWLPVNVPPLKKQREIVGEMQLLEENVNKLIRRNLQINGYLEEWLSAKFIELTAGR